MNTKLSAGSHRLRGFCAMLVLVASSFAAPPAIQATSGGCQDSEYNWTHVGNTRDPNPGSIKGIKATIHTGGGNPHFWACSGTSAGNDGTMGWVNIVPGSTAPSSTPEMIVQVGIVRCTVVLAFVCTNSVPHFTWAHGGCGWPIVNPPDLEDLGETTYLGTHNYEIVWESNLWKFKIDGVTKASLTTTADSVDCWITNDRRADWFAERYDRGDSVGSNGTTSQRMQFTAMRYKYDSTSYITPVISSCAFNEDPSGAGRYVCSTGGSDWFHVWNVNP